jgi:SAM-dependent methyltransferase
MPPGVEPDAARAVAVAPAKGPSVVDLLRLSRSKGFSAGDQPLYRQIAKRTGLVKDAPHRSLLDVPCGWGAVVQFFASHYDVDAVGVDPDPDLVEIAEDRARAADLSTRLHFQSAPVDDLPLQDEVFDLTIGEVGLASAENPFRAVAELARVTRPGGHVAVICLIWTGHVDQEQRTILVEHLGARPLLLVEWKRALLEANVGDLRVEDWSDQAFPFLVRGRTFRSPTDLHTLAGKLKILRRAWRRWGWRGLRGALRREMRIRNLLGPERTIGVSLIVGTKNRAAGA